jgi:uncharacterized protein YqeY
MSLVKEIGDDYRAALKARDAERTSALRMVRARLKQHAIDRRVAGELTDEVARQVIASYVKQLRKSIPEFEKGGAAASERIAQIEREIASLEPYLPRLLDEAETRRIVAAAIEALDHPPPGKAGMVIGRVMKEQPGAVDPVLVRRLVEEALGE